MSVFIQIIIIIIIIIMIIIIIIIIIKTRVKQTHTQTCFSSSDFIGVVLRTVCSVLMLLSSH